MVPQGHEKSIRVFEYLVLIGLLLGVGYFVQDVCKDYFSQTTSIKQYTEIWESLPAPTVTICFNPGAKKSVLTKYNLNLLQFSGFDSTGSNFSLYDEGTFKMGRDFKVTIKDNYDKKINLSLGNGIEELVTFFNGRCYKLTFDFELMSTEYLTIAVDVNENITTEDIPFIDFSLTTEAEAYGVIIDKFSNVNDLIYTSTKPGPEGFYSTLLQGSVYKRLKSTSNCIPNAHLMKCLSQK